MRILFICKANVCRSQTAEILFNKLTNNKYSIRSAGLDPTELQRWENQKLSKVKELAQCLEEVGCSLDGKRSKKLTEEMVNWADKIIVMEKEGWSDFLKNSKKVIYWEIEDPGNKNLATHRIVRDKIKQRIEKFIKEYNL